MVNDRSNKINVDKWKVKSEGESTVPKIEVTESRATSYKIDVKTPTFKSRTDENVDTWLFKVETAFEFAAIPKNKWLVAVSNYVEGTALEMVIQGRKDNISWDNFKQKMLEIESAY